VWLEAAELGLLAARFAPAPGAPGAPDGAGAGAGGAAVSVEAVADAVARVLAGEGVAEANGSKGWGGERPASPETGPRGAGGGAEGAEWAAGRGRVALVQGLLLRAAQRGIRAAGAEAARRGDGGGLAPRADALRAVEEGLGWALGADEAERLRQTFEPLGDGRVAARALFAALAAALDAALPPPGAAGRARHGPAPPRPAPPPAGSIAAGNLGAGASRPRPRLSRRGGGGQRWGWKRARWKSAWPSMPPCAPRRALATRSAHPPPAPPTGTWPCCPAPAPTPRRAALARRRRPARADAAAVGARLERVRFAPARERRARLDLESRACGAAPPVPRAIAAARARDPRAEAVCNAANAFATLHGRIPAPLAALSGVAPALSDGAHPGEGGGARVRDVSPPQARAERERARHMRALLAPCTPPTTTYAAFAASCRAGSRGEADWDGRGLRSSLGARVQDSPGSP
jgi:hypothetical protein